MGSMFRVIWDEIVLVWIGYCALIECVDSDNYYHIISYLIMS